MPKWKIRFVKEGVEERAPKNPGKGGFERHVIPVGTEKEVNDASLNFWIAKGCVENLGRVPDPLPPPFGIQQPQTSQQPQTGQQPPAVKITKADLRLGLEAALAALDGGNQVAFTTQLKTIAELDREQVDDKFAELNSDSRMLLTTAFDDAKAGEVHGSPAEIRDALLDAIDILLPPTRRTRNR